MLPHRSRRKVDIVFSIALIAFGIVILIAASRMPWTTARTGASAQWYLSPGLYPAVLGMFLIVFSLSVLRIAIKEVGVGDIGTMFLAWLRALPSNIALHRVVTMMVLVGLYIFVGIGSADFRLVSAIFLFVFIAIFWFPEPGQSLKIRIPITLAIAAIVPSAITYIFETYLFVPMP